MAVYTVEPGSPSHDALNFLVNFAATLDQAETDRAMKMDLGRQRQSPLADPGYGTVPTDYGTMLVSYLRFRGIDDPVFRREEILEPVTNQVTTAPGNGRPSAT
jgi:hypothetical protein